MRRRQTRSCLLFAINIYDEPRGTNTFASQTFQRGGRRDGKLNHRRAGGTISSRMARTVLNRAMWVVRYRTTRVALISRDETYCGRERRRDGERIFPSRSRTSRNVTMINRARERRRQGRPRRAAATLARHNLFLLAAPRALKTLPKKSGGKTAGKAATGGKEGPRPRELLRRHCHVSLIGHIAAKNISRPHRSHELSISGYSCSHACRERCY